MARSSHVSRANSTPSRGRRHRFGVELGGRSAGDQVAHRSRLSARRGGPPAAATRGDRSWARGSAPAPRGSRAHRRRARRRRQLLGQQLAQAAGAFYAPAALGPLRRPDSSGVERRCSSHRGDPSGVFPMICRATVNACGGARTDRSGGRDLIGALKADTVSVLSAVPAGGAPHIG